MLYEYNTRFNVSWTKHAAFDKTMHLGRLSKQILGSEGIHIPLVKFNTCAHLYSNNDLFRTSYTVLTL